MIQFNAVSSKAMELQQAFVRSEAPTRSRRSDQSRYQRRFFFFLSSSVRPPVSVRCSAVQVHVQIQICFGFSVPFAAAAGARHGSYRATATTAPRLGPARSVPRQQPRREGGTRPRRGMEAWRGPSRGHGPFHRLGEAHG